MYLNNKFASLRNDEENKNILVFLNSFQAINQKIENLYNFLTNYSSNSYGFYLQRQIGEFKEKYEKYIGITRFSIPVIGKMNTGKSTFLNYLIHLNESLEIKSEIATKFVCIIRHNKKNIEPKIYETKAILRGNNKVFNFIKGKRINFRSFILFFNNRSKYSFI